MFEPSISLNDGVMLVFNAKSEKLSELGPSPRYYLFMGLLHDYFDYLTFEAPSYSMSSIKLFETPNQTSFVIIGDFFA
jgi:hypothetical protein